MDRAAALRKGYHNDKGIKRIKKHRINEGSALFLRFFEKNENVLRNLLKAIDIFTVLKYNSYKFLQDAIS